MIEQPIYNSITLSDYAYFNSEEGLAVKTVEVCFKHNSSNERCVFGVSTNDADNWQNDGKVFAIYVSNNHINAYVNKKYEFSLKCNHFCNNCHRFFGKCGDYFLLLLKFLDFTIRNIRFDVINCMYNTNCIR